MGVGIIFRAKAPHKKSKIMNAPDRFLTWRWEEEPEDEVEENEMETNLSHRPGKLYTLKKQFRRKSPKPVTF